MLDQCLGGIDEYITGLAIHGWWHRLCCTGMRGQSGIWDTFKLAAYELQ